MLQATPKPPFWQHTNPTFVTLTITMRVTALPPEIGKPSPAPHQAKTKRKGSGSLEPKELGISGARIYSAASAGVSLTFINPASSVVLGYDLDLGSSAKLDFLLIVFHS